MAGRIAAWGFGGLITLLYAYMVVAAVGNFVLLPQMGAQLGLSISGVGWFWLGLGVALPILGYLVALLLARGRGAGSRLLVLAAGVCVVAAFQLEILHLVPQSSFFA